jgi:hypothetical protein
MRRLLLSCSAVALSLTALAGAGCSGEPDGAERCGAPTKEACLQDRECAWGTGAEGPYCFWVGVVDLQ